MGLPSVMIKGGIGGRRFVNSEHYETKLCSPRDRFSPANGPSLITIVKEVVVCLGDIGHIR
jgi:hypothetical protein